MIFKEEGSSNVTCINDEQPEKAHSSIFSTEEGIFMKTREEQSLNEFFPMYKTVESSFTDVISLFFLKVSSDVAIPEIETAIFRSLMNESLMSDNILNVFEKFSDGYLISIETLLNCLINSINSDESSELFK